MSHTLMAQSNLCRKVQESKLRQRNYFQLCSNTFKTAAPHNVAEYTHNSIRVWKHDCTINVTNSTQAVLSAVFVLHHPNHFLLAGIWNCLGLKCHYHPTIPHGPCSSKSRFQYILTVSAFVYIGTSFQHAFSGFCLLGGNQSQHPSIHSKLCPKPSSISDRQLRGKCGCYKGGTDLVLIFFR